MLSITVNTLVDENDGISVGGVSLRDAVAYAATQTGPDTIEFHSSLAGGVIGLTNGQITINSDVAIQGLGKDQLTISGNDQSRVFLVNSGVTATISDVTIRDGNVAGTNRGGGISNAGNLALDAVVMTDNHSIDNGGAIHSTGKLRVVDSYFYVNVSGTSGGAIHVQTNNTDALVVENSTFASNEALNGGAIRMHGSAGSGTATIVNSTFSGNTAAQHAGAIQLTSVAPVLTIINCTITDNEADTNKSDSTSGEGGGLYLGGGVVKLFNSIVVGNTAYSASGNDILGNLQSTSDYNLLGSGESNQPGSHNVITNNAGLTPLGDYGGPTLSHALLTTSSALDKGSDASAVDYLSNPLIYDQRGSARNFDSGAAGPSGGTVDIGAYEFSFTGPLVVSTLVDESDARYGSGDLSLREALELANFFPGVNTITFAEELFTGGPATITLTYDGPNSGAGPDVLIVSNVTIQGPGADKIIISGGGQTQVINASLSTIEGVTITGGNAASGGGIWGSSTTIRKSRITGNTATFSGGGIYAYGDFTLIDSEVSDNVAVYSGGGISNFRLNTYAGLKIVNSTISGNDVSNQTGRGGGLYAFLYNDTYGDGLDATITNSTISGNSAEEGGGIFTMSGYPVTMPRFAKVHNTIIAGNTNLTGAASDVAGNDLNASSSFDLIGPGGTGGLINGGTNQNILLSLGQSAGLAPLDFYGGPTRTHALLDGSPAIDAGDPAALAGTNGIPEFDQRGEGFGRVGDGDLDATLRLDIGAVEWSTTQWEVDTLIDESDGNYGPGDLSLREALARASQRSCTNRITFAPNLFTSGSATITLAYDGIDPGTGPDALSIDSNVTIEGPSAKQLTISGGNLTRVFEVSNAAIATLRGMTITGGAAGAIYSEAMLTISETSITGNLSASSAIVDQNGGTLIISGSTIFNNDGDGESVLALRDSDSVYMVNTTISGNQGYAAVIADNTIVTVTNTTIAFNESSNGGFMAVDSDVTVRNTIIAGNTDGAIANDVIGTFNSASGHNLIGAIDGSTGLNAATTQFGNASSPLDAGLSVLGDYGGPTKTHALFIGSPALESGLNDWARNARGNLLTSDQRGHVRPFDLPDVVNPNGNITDIGAFEAGNQIDTITVRVLEDELEPGEDINSLDLSLREAIELSKTLAGGAIIVFAPTLFSEGPGTLELSYDGSDLDAEVDPLVFGNFVQIHGPGAGLLTLDANDAYSVFLMALSNNS